MNKTLIAALSGIAFGSVLGGVAATQFGQPGSHQLQISIADCSNAITAPVCPPGPPPPSCVHDDAELAQLPMDANSQLSQAQTEYVNGNFQRAIEIAQTLTTQSPERSFRILGAAACNTGNTELAAHAYKNLQASSRQYLIYTCQRHDIVWTKNHFRHRD